MQPRTKLVSAVLLVVIAFVVMFYAVPGVAAAIQRWFGYVPGIGLVHEGEIRVLKAPVAVTREGITITVEQALLNAERSTLVYTAENIPQDAMIVDPRESCAYKVDLRLPDGSTAANVHFGTNNDRWSSGYQHQINFGAIPTSVQDATLEISCLFPTRAGAAPENWAIPLHFVPAPPDMTAFPVIEIATPTAEAQAEVTEPPAADAPAATETSVQGTPSAADSGVSLTLDRAVQMDDGYLIYATLHWKDSPYNTVDVGTIRLLDSSGQEMVYEHHVDDLTNPNYEQRQSTFAIKTAPVQAPGPLTLVVDGILVDQTVDATFVFDPGKNPQPGQTWRIDQVLQIGEHRVYVHSARAEETGYIYELSSDTGIIYAALVDNDHPVVAGGGGGGGGELGQKFESGFYYANGLPTGPITLHVAGIVTMRPEIFQAQWTPPAASANPLPTQPAACLNAAAWKQAKAQQQALPEGLGGKVVVSGPLEGQPGEYGVWISGLDGSGKQPLPGAQDAAFSPDGTKLAYSTLKDGITLMDMASGQSAHLAGTNGGDFNPLWSPDGKQIVFNRGAGLYDLFIIDVPADGAATTDGAPRRLTTGGVQEWSVGWLPGGSLLYTVPERIHEYTSYMLNVQTGESQIFSHTNIASIAPNQQHMLTNEYVFGDRWLTYISEVDHSNRWLLASDDLWVMSPLWSPDGNWLLTALSDTDSGSTTGALVNPRTCQVIAVPQLKGTFLSWTK